MLAILAPEEFPQTFDPDTNDWDPLIGSLWVLLGGLDIFIIGKYQRGLDYDIVRPRFRGMQENRCCGHEKLLVLSYQQLPNWYNWLPFERNLSLGGGGEKGEERKGRKGKKEIPGGAKRLVGGIATLKEAKCLEIPRAGRTPSKHFIEQGVGAPPMTIVTPKQLQREDRERKRSKKEIVKKRLILGGNLIVAVVS